jgi:hypothetical protein
LTPILDRIRANGGEVIRDKWNIRIRPGRLTPEALAWLRTNADRIKEEVWPEFHWWIRQVYHHQFVLGTSRDEAERAAYAEVAGC